MTPPPSITFGIIILFGITIGVWFLACYSELPFRHRALLPLVPRRRLFLFYLFSLAAKMAKADGRVSEDEVRLFRERVRTTIRLTPVEERQVADIFRHAKESPTTFAELAEEFVQHYRDEPGVLVAMLSLLGEFAAVDGTIAAREYTCLTEFAGLIHMAPHRFAALMAETCRGVKVEEPAEEFGQEHLSDDEALYHRLTPLQEAYETLGLKPDATWEVVRTTYRTLAKHYHPDRLRAQGVPTESVRAATERFRVLKDAYELIRQERGK